MPKAQLSSHSLLPSDKYNGEVIRSGILKATSCVSSITLHDFVYWSSSFFFVQSDLIKMQFTVLSLSIPYNFVMKAGSLHCGFTLKTDLQKWLWNIFFQRSQHLSLYKAKIPVFQSALQAWPGHSSGQLPLPYSYNRFTEPSLAVSQASPKPLLGHRCVGDSSASWGRYSALLPQPCLYCGNRRKEMFLIQTLWLEFTQGEDLSITGILPAQEKTCACDMRCKLSEPACRS